MKSRLALTGLIILGLIVTAGDAFAFKMKGMYGVRVGYSMLNGDEDFWRDMSQDFKEDEGDFSSVIYGIYGYWPITPFLDLGFGVDYIKREADIHSKYIYDLNGDGMELVFGFKNTVKFQMLPLHLMDVRVLPLGRKRIVSPFASIGFALVFWEYEEKGTFVMPDPNTDIDRDGRWGGSEIPDFIAINDSTDHSDTDLAIELSVGIDFNIHKNFVISLLGKYSFMDEQVNKQFYVPNVRPSAQGEINLTDVRVSLINNFVQIELGTLEGFVSMMYRF